MVPTEALSELAGALRDAAEREDWEQAQALFERFQQKTADLPPHALAGGQLAAALAALNEAIAHTRRRREEIRDLVEKLSGQPL